MISKNEMAKLAALARIELGEAELATLASDAERILAYVSQLPASEPSPAGLNDTECPLILNIWRADGAPHPPASGGEFVRVKKIL